jgi:hypothetical protein
MHPSAQKVNPPNLALWVFCELPLCGVFGPRMGLGAWVEDFKLTPYAKDIERYAIVSDSNLFEWTSKIAEAFIAGEVRRFEDSRYEEAWRWVRS